MTRRHANELQKSLYTARLAQKVNPNDDRTAHSARLSEISSGGRLQCQWRSESARCANGPTGDTLRVDVRSSCLHRWSRRRLRWRLHVALECAPPVIVCRMPIGAHKAEPRDCVGAARALHDSEAPDAPRGEAARAAAAAHTGIANGPLMTDARSVAAERLSSR